MQHRYIIQLLPTDTQRQTLDQWRTELARLVGPNKALAYPTCHATLVWNIEDTLHAVPPIDREELVEILASYRGVGPIELPVTVLTSSKEHLTLTAEDNPQLQSMRHSLFQKVVEVVSEDGRYTDRSDKVKEQIWPHFTLAQDIDPNYFTAGLIYLRQNADLIAERLVCDHLALLERIIGNSLPYQIVEMVKL